MNKKESITEAHVFHRLMRICVQREVKLAFVFLSIRNIVSFVPGKDLIPGGSLQLEGDKDYLRNCMGALPLAHLGISKGLGHFLKGEFEERGGNEALALETYETLPRWEESDSTTGLCENSSTLELSLPPVSWPRIAMSCWTISIWWHDCPWEELCLKHDITYWGSVPFAFSH